MLFVMFRDGNNKPIKIIHIGNIKTIYYLRDEGKFIIETDRRSYSCKITELAFMTLDELRHFITIEMETLEKNKGKDKNG